MQVQVASGGACRHGLVQLREACGCMGNNEPEDLVQVQVAPGRTRALCLETCLLVHCVWQLHRADVLCPRTEWSLGVQAGKCVGWLLININGVCVNWSEKCRMQIRAMMEPWGSVWAMASPALCAGGCCSLSARQCLVRCRHGPFRSSPSLH